MSYKEIVLDPVTRIEGHMAVHVKIDTAQKKIVEAHSYGTMFRGWEIILRNRDPPDAPYLTQRICGVCPVPHAYASAIALDMALHAKPPKLAVVLRNLTDAAEITYDHPIHLFQLAGPDYSEAVVSKYTPSVWTAAQSWSCPNRDTHGYSTMADLMKAMNPLSGKLYLFSLKIERLCRKAASLLGAKHPHVNTFIPGGVARTWTANEAERLTSMFITIAGFMKLLVAVWEDISAFLYDQGYDWEGARVANLMAFGSIEDPETYDGTYENMSTWAEKRLFTPGVVLNATNLVTTDVKKIHLGVREYVERSFYDDWVSEAEYDKDPEGNPLNPRHPWNKITKPKPAPTNYSQKYSWGTSPRWYNSDDGKLYAVEVGPIARIWTTALAGKVNVQDPFVEIHSGNGKVTIALPETRTPDLPASLYDAVELEWSVPVLSKNGTRYTNLIERLRARAFNGAFYAASALHDVYEMISLIGQGETSVWTKFERPAGPSFGVGLNEAGRGALGHWVIVQNGRIHRYQIITPTNWNISPTVEGLTGPTEEACLDSTITEESTPDKWIGLDPIRITRSFDPCLACTVHIFVGKRHIKRDAFLERII